MDHQLLLIEDDERIRQIVERGLDRHRGLAAGRPVPLRARGPRLAAASLRPPGALLPRDGLFGLAWESEFAPGSSAVGVYVAARPRKRGPARMKRGRGRGSRLR